MRIKTIATLGPSSKNYQTIKLMVNYGVRIFRLNFSHGQAKDFEPIITLIRDLEKELDLSLTIMGDLSGPKIRIGEVEDSPVRIPKGSYVYLGLNKYKPIATEYSFISLDSPEILKDLSVNMSVFLGDGVILFRVKKAMEKDKLFLLEAQNEGILTSHKGINFPQKKIALSALTDKDITDLHQGIKMGIDSFALSFVQNKTDIEKLKKEMGKYNDQIPVIAKLERAASLENLNEIISVADGIMIARGDLGLECSLPSLPIIQKNIIKASRNKQKPSIVATQMLLSMVDNPRPTRAETTDAANAILDEADCVMLSEETAIGRYPVEAVRFIQDIAEQAESYLLEKIQGPYYPHHPQNISEHLAYSACLIAEHTDSTALVCHTNSGKTAAILSSRRPAQPIYALTPSMKAVRALNFYWGVRAKFTDTTISNHLERAENFVQNHPTFQPGQSIVITSGQPTPGQSESHTNQIKIYYK